MLYIKSKIPAAESQIQIENESLVEFLFHDAPDAIFILEPKSYTIIECNKRAMELFEATTKSSLLNLSSFRLYESEPIEFSRNLLESHIKNNGEHSQELAFRTLRQNVFWGKLTKRVFKTDNRELVVLRINKAGDNVRAEEAISTLLRGTAKVTGHKYFKELTRLLCRNFDVDYAFVGKVAQQENVLNILESTGELAGADQKNFPLNGSMLENIMKGYTTFYAKDVAEMFPGDKIAQANNIEGFMGTPVFGGSGEVIGVIGFFHSKSIDELPNSRYILSIFASRTAAELQRIRSKQMLKEQTRSLAHINSVKDKLLSVLSHDLINPLHTIMGFSELLRSKVKEYDKERIVERVEIIDNSIRNIYFMLDNLNAWSGIYREKLRPHMQELKLIELIEENLAHFKYVAESKNISIKLDVASCPIVYSDAMMLSTIIRNLLSNSIKYTPKRGSVSVSCEALGDKFMLKIVDTGIGIDATDLERINSANSAVPEVNILNRKGTGLGLILSKNYAERMGGNLQISSMSERGTKVVLTIPRAIK